MTSFNIDEVLSKLSTKFNKIFYDREFVCCVNQDFQVVLKNKSTCCVVVFPVLGPNYLKAVRYQAKIFDLAVFTLGTGRHRAIAVCQKEYLRKNSNEVIEATNTQIMPQSAVDSNTDKLRKKRPERQLYVPPAQRRVSVITEEIPCTRKKDNTINEESIERKKILNSSIIKKPNVSREYEKRHSRPKQYVLETNDKQEFKEEITEFSNKDNSKDIESESEKQVCLDYLFSINYICILWNYRLCKNSLPCKKIFKFSNYFHFDKEFPLYKLSSSRNSLYILHKNFVLWQPSSNIYINRSKTSSDTSTYPIYNFNETITRPCDCSLQQRIPIFSDIELSTIFESISKNFDYSEHTSFRILCNKSVYVSKSDVIVDLSSINCGHNFIIRSENGSHYFYECIEVHDVLECYNGKKKELKNCPLNCKNDNVLQLDQTEIPLIKNNVIVLENRLPNKTNNNPNVTVKKNNDRNINNNVISNLNNEIITPKKSSEHEQEKEIMRKTKEQINRKTRPIMKYVDDTADTLKIYKNDDINNWEELFDDDGQLQEELFKEVVHKVGTEFIIVKAKEDYSDYVTKASEDLEHMVELYDFPPTLETHDIIQAFSVINSEAMYVKWVDDTHAILVLGSLTQAQKAVELDNPLIKARPMAVASRVSLEAAYRNDLKPAMKRPQTNLQTARRLITTHLGTKSRVSKEQNAKERNDLKAARELKRLAKKNEQDAWEGNLRSAIN